MTKAKETTTDNQAQSQEPDLVGAIADIDVVAEKPKKIPPEQVVSQGYTQIKKALAQGYSFTDLAKIFNKRRVKISAQQLKEHYEQFEASQHSEKALETAPPHVPTAVAAAETASPKTVIKHAKRTAEEEAAQMALAES